MILLQHGDKASATVCHLLPLAWVGGSGISGHVGCTRCAGGDNQPTAKAEQTIIRVGIELTDTFRLLAV